MEPITDHDGARLEVGECGQGEHGYLDVTARGDSVQVCVDPLEILDLTVALYRAAGQEPPVMLGRPDVAVMRDRDGWVALRGLQARRADGGVTVAIGGNAETLTEASARQFAAVVTALADERPEPDPDPDDVDALAIVLTETLNPAVMGIAGARPLARKILAAGWKRGESRG